MNNSALHIILEEEIEHLEPGGCAHNLAWELVGTIRHNYSKHCRTTLRDAAWKILELVNLIEDYDFSGRDYAEEEALCRKAIHAIS